MRPDTGWMVDGACRGVDPDLFFPERGESSDEAKAVCAVCPVQAECLRWALLTREAHGIWGGKSERQRRAMRGRMPRYCITCWVEFQPASASHRVCEPCRVDAALKLGQFGRAERLAS